MKNKKKIIIGLAIALAVASLILIVILVVNRKPSLEDQLKEATINYYENEYKNFFPNTLKQWGEFNIDLDALASYDVDISVFEEHNCDKKDTYVTFIYKDESSYDTKVHLACEE